MTSDSWYLTLSSDTFLRTPEGIRNIVDVRAGSRLISADGESVAVTTVRSLSEGGPATLRHSVVEIQAGALDENVPSQTVDFPAETLLRIGDARIKATLLANSMTILAKDADPAKLVYVGLKKPGAFDVAGLLVVAAAAGKSKVDVESDAADKLTATKTKALSRAIESGWCRVEDRRVQVAVDGSILTPVAETSSRLWFIVRKPARVFQLYSAAAIVSDWAPASPDGRTLGVQIMGLRADGEDLPLDGACFGQGFHGLETDGSKRPFRWINGSSTLNLAAPARVLEITIGLGAAVMRHSKTGQG